MERIHRSRSLTFFAEAGWRGGGGGSSLAPVFMNCVFIKAGVLLFCFVFFAVMFFKGAWGVNEFRGELLKEKGTKALSLKGSNTH